jgi:hypothetical protein
MKQWLFAKSLLSPGFLKDRMVWTGTKNGEFTVRSAYHLCKEIQDREDS